MINKILKSPKLNLILIWTSQLSAVAINALLQFWLAVKLSPDEYGDLVTLITLANILISIGAFGIGQYILQDIKNNKLVMNSLLLLLWINIFLVFFIFIFTLFVDELILMYIKYFSFIIVAGSILSFNLSFYQSRDNFLNYSLLYFTNHLLRASSIFFPLLFGLSLLSTLKLQLPIGILIFISYIILTKSNLRDITININKGFYKEIFQILPYASTTIIFLVYQYINVLLINIFLSSEDAANYFLSFSILTIFYLIPNSIFSIFLLPKIHAMNDKNMILKFMVRMKKIMFFASAICALLFVVIGYVISISSFGEKYHGMFNIMLLMSLLIVVKFLSSIADGVLNKGFLIRHKVNIQFQMFIINVIINLVLLKFIGVYGSIISLLVSELYFLLISEDRIRKNLKNNLII